MTSVKAELDALLARFDKNAHRKGKVTLEPILSVLERLGRPQDRFPPVIHIAGTNGKGSTAAFIRAMAEAGGLRVHVSTSPHLVRVNERIRLAGTLIEDEHLLDCARRAADAAEGITVSYFELTFAAACLAFAETPADLLILEVGLGGRLDASNVVDVPAVSVLTPIAYDHQAILGQTLSKIAWKKAGIIKQGCPVVSANQVDEAANVIAEEAFALEAPLHIIGPADIAATPIELSLPGDYQRANAALAAKALTVWGHERVTSDAIAKGAAAAVWPARLQKMAAGPLVACANGADVWLDGGHNPHAGQAIARFLSDQPGETVLLTAMMSGKDAMGFFKAFVGVASKVFTCPNAGGTLGTEPDMLARQAHTVGLAAEAHSSFETAFQAAAEAGAARILICGSLYLAGYVLDKNDQPPD